MERRAVLRAIGSASVTALTMNPLTQFAHARQTTRSEAPSGGTLFETLDVEVADNTVFVRRYGKGPAILLVHGFPRTSLIW